MDVARFAYEIDSVFEDGAEITVLTLSGRVEPANMQALLARMQDLARERGALLLLVDETDMRPSAIGFSEIHDLVNDWRKDNSLKSSRIAVVAVNPILRGLNQGFRMLINREGGNSMNAFSRRADAISWLVRTPTLP